MKLFSFPIKHDFDLENPIQDEVIVTYQYKLSGRTVQHVLKPTGFVCKKCGKVLWLDKEDMKNLPPSMKYGCKKDKK